MTIKKTNPYLMFNGNAAKAIKFYEAVLGAKVEAVMRFDQIPGNTPAPENKDRIIHALLKIGADTIMISDAQAGTPEERPGNIRLSLDFDTVEDLVAKFDALAKDGEVTLAPQDSFWSAKFGMCTDAFGIQWMLNCDLKKGEK